MQVDLFLNEVPDGDSRLSQACTRFAEFVLSQAARIDVSDTAVGRILIASEKRYGEAIASVSPDARFTDTNVRRGVAKALLQSDGHGSAIVILENFVGGLLAAIDRGPDIERWPVEDQLAAYVIAHELGHCKDYLLRGSPASGPPEIDTEAFQIGNIARYYSDILASEFFACAHSAAAVGRELYRHESASSEATAVEAIAEAQVEAQRYRITGVDLATVAYSASGAFWFALQQINKLHAFRVANDGLSSELAPRFAIGGAVSETCYQRLSAESATWWREYPDVPSMPTTELVTIWRDFCLDSGFDFVEGTAGDSLWLR